MQPDSGNASKPGGMLSARFAVFYGAVFFLIGVHGPWWPLWLAGRGVGPAGVGLLLAAGFWIRTGASPLAAWLADRSGRHRLVMGLLALGTLLGFVAFLPARGLPALLAVTVVTMALFGPLIPLGEAATVAAARRHRLSYGRIRLWGSMAFILGAVGVGRLLVEWPTELILWLLIGTAALLLPAVLLLPRQAAAESPAGTENRRRGVLREALRTPGFPLLLLAAGLLQSSHAAYYGFSALHWRDAGIPTDVVGALWAEGVVAEIVLFAAGVGLARRAGPSGLLLLGAAGGVLRWTVSGLTVDPLALMAVQWLHALTFGAVHLGAMEWLSRNMAGRVLATAQGIYSALAMAAAGGIVLPLAGLLYVGSGGAVFLAMAGLSLAGGVVAAGLGRSDRRGRTGAGGGSTAPGNRVS